jgi:hypothetical protein
VVAIASSWEFREGNWKYILDIGDGVEQLYDLDRDPSEQQKAAACRMD